MFTIKLSSHNKLICNIFYFNYITPSWSCRKSLFCDDNELFSSEVLFSTVHLYHNAFIVLFSDSSSNFKISLVPSELFSGISTFLIFDLLESYFWDYTDFDLSKLFSFENRSLISDCFGRYSKKIHIHCSKYGKILEFPH